MQCVRREEKQQKINQKLILGVFFLSEILGEIISLNEFNTSTARLFREA